MKQIILTILFCLLCVFGQAQKEFHVFPNGNATGNGSLDNPWDLQTALNQKPKIVNGDDTIWLHEGVYKGRFVSKIQSTKANRFITVGAFKNQKVVLDGNDGTDKGAVLSVKGKQVIFRDFEITWLGTFSRQEGDADFRVGGGINHTAGEDCRFYNLTIYNTPGLGIGSWKHGGGTIIENCTIYYNGYIAKDGKGRGEGIYVQNKSDNVRLIKNNVIFSNYYKGIEVWSAGRNADFEYVKNITLEGNIIFNSGSPSGNHYDNVIVATDDRNGTNFAKNIKVLNNIFYHNTDYLTNQVNGDAPSLTIGYVDNAPAENITIKDNIILGRNNALRFLHVKSMTFTNNLVYGGYVLFNANEMQYSKDWTVKKNVYYTKNSTPFRINRDKSYKFKDWKSTYNLDMDSEAKHIKEFDLKPLLIASKQAQRSHTYTIALFNKEGKDVVVDVSEYSIKKGTNYRIYDVENRTLILASGVVDASKKLTIPMNSVAFENPLHATKAKKTLSNFGVFTLEFDSKKP